MAASAQALVGRRGFDRIKKGSMVAGVNAICTIRLEDKRGNGLCSPPNTTALLALVESSVYILYHVTRD